MIADQHAGDRTGTSAFAAPDGITLAKVRATARYDVRCDVYEWIGRIPEYED
jgi:hypothetical protein